MGLNIHQRSEYGKPCAMKVACTVWSGGKAEKPYLSLPNSVNLYKPTSGRFFHHGADRRGHLLLERGSIRLLLLTLSHHPLHAMTRQLHLAVVALKRKPASRGKKAPRAPSIVGSFSPQPWLESAGDSVAPDVCHLVLAAAQASPAAIHGGAQRERTRATTPDWPAAVGTAGTWPRCVVRALPPHGGPSDSPAR